MGFPGMPAKALPCAVRSMPASLQAMPLHQYFFSAPGGFVGHVRPPVPEAFLKKTTEVTSNNPPLGVQYPLVREGVRPTDAPIRYHSRGDVGGQH